MLWEEDKWNPPDNQRHRYQMVAVVRDDKPAIFTQDLGPSVKYPGIPFQAHGAVKSDTGHTFIIHTVSELQYYAEISRNSPMVIEGYVPDFESAFEEIRGRKNGN